MVERAVVGLVVLVLVLVLVLVAPKSMLNTPVPVMTFIVYVLVPAVTT